MQCTLELRSIIKDQRHAKIKDWPSAVDCHVGIWVISSRRTEAYSTCNVTIKVQVKISPSVKIKTRTSIQSSGLKASTRSVKKNVKKNPLQLKLSTRYDLVRFLLSNKFKLIKHVSKLCLQKRIFLYLSSIYAERYSFQINVLLDQFILPWLSSEIFNILKIFHS